METEEASNGDLRKGFKENEGDGEKKSPEGGEEPKIKDPEEGTIVHPRYLKIILVFKSSYGLISKVSSPIFPQVKFTLILISQLNAQWCEYSDLVMLELMA